jgi:hypothetical protein
MMATIPAGMPSSESVAVVETGWGSGCRAVGGSVGAVVGLQVSPGPVGVDVVGAAVRSLLELAGSSPSRIRAGAEVGSRVVGTGVVGDGVGAVVVGAVVGAVVGSGVGAGVGAGVGGTVDGGCVPSDGQTTPSSQLPWAGNRDWSPSCAPQAQHGVQKYPGESDPAAYPSPQNRRCTVSATSG